VLHESIAIEVFGHQIRRVIHAGDLEDLELVFEGPLLDPQILDFEMPKLPKSMACSNPNGRTRITVDSAIHLVAQVPRKRYHAKAVGAAFDHREKFRFA